MESMGQQGPLDGLIKPSTFPSHRQEEHSSHFRIHEGKNTNSQTIGSGPTRNWITHRAADVSTLWDEQGKGPFSPQDWERQELWGYSTKASFVCKLFIFPTVSCTRLGKNQGLNKYLYEGRKEWENRKSYLWNGKQKYQEEKKNSVGLESVLSPFLWEIFISSSSFQYILLL